MLAALPHIIAAFGAGIALASLADDARRFRSIMGRLGCQLAAMES